MEQELCCWLTGFGRQAKPDGRVFTGGGQGLGGCLDCSFDYRLYHSLAMGAAMIWLEYECTCRTLAFGSHYIDSIGGWWTLQSGDWWKMAQGQAW